MRIRSIPVCGLARRAYSTILERIVRGDYAIGQSISRRTIARDLGISFLPASEALLRLEYEGFVESRPRAGTRMRIPSRSDAEGHFLVTEALEVQAAMMFALTSTASERAELIKLAAHLDAEAVKQRSGPLDECPALHEQLHLKIAEYARCEALNEAIGRQRSLTSAWLCAMKVIVPGNNRPKHELLIRALLRHKPAAAHTMRVHLRAEAEWLLHSLEPKFEMNKKYLQTYSRSIVRRSVQAASGSEVLAGLTGNIPPVPLPAVHFRPL